MSIFGQRQFLVKRHHPWRRGITIVLLVIVTVAGGYGLYDFGRYRGGYDSAIARDKAGQLLQEIEKLNAQNDLLMNQKAMLDRSSRIDRNAHDEVKLALKVAQQQSLELREELAFYRSLVSPSAMEPGLQVQSFSVEEDEEPATFNYKLVLTQVRKNNREAIGTADLRFSGMLGDKAVTYALADVAKLNTKHLNFRFKYFQNIEGNLRFPKRFVPKSVFIAIKPTGKRLKAVKKNLKWETALTRSQ